MENSYVIKWSSLDKTRFGQGKKMMSAEEAIRLANELNEEYPSFVHEPLNLSPAVAIVSTSLPETVEAPAEAAVIIDFPAQEAAIAV